MVKHGIFTGHLQNVRGMAHPCSACPDQDKNEGPTSTEDCYLPIRAMRERNGPPMQCQPRSLQPNPGSFFM